MSLNAKLPSYLLGKYQLTGTVTFSVLFALVFLNIYIPFSDTAWFGFGDSVMSVLTLLFCSAAIGVLIASRVLMYKSKKYFQMTYWAYVLWCIAEIASICGFYTWLTVDITSPENALAPEIFGKAFLYGAIALLVPYIISAMYFAIIDKNKTISLMSYENIVTDEAPKADTPLQKITLFDNSGSLKLSLSPENQYMLRCRLKTVEESFKGSDLVRCNRKYIVNIKKVRLLHKESEGYVLDLDNESIPPLPVTKTYTDAVLSHFTDQSPLLEPIE